MKCKFIFLAAPLFFISSLYGELQLEPKTNEINGAETSKTILEQPINIAENAPYDENSFWGELVNMLVTLGCILALLVGLMWIMRRMQNSRIKLANEAGIIKVIDQRALSPKTIVYILNINQTAYIVAEGQSGAVKLGECPASEITNAPTSTSGPIGFNAIFDRK